jgi:hypothetical protein
MSSLLSLSCADRAAFAVTSRLLSCLITESLLKALFVPIHSEKAVGACVVLSNQASAAGVPLQKPYRPADIFVIVPLRALPVIKPSSNASLGKEIGLIDPLDMLPWIYEVREDLNPNPALKVEILLRRFYFRADRADSSTFPRLYCPAFLSHTMTSPKTPPSLSPWISYTYGRNSRRSSASTLRMKTP